MIKRISLNKIRAAAKQFPAVLLIGPRQCGKTTLVKNFVEGKYFDLERPSDMQIFSLNPEFALDGLPRPLILDEAQNLPEMFNVLRSIIDDDRKNYGQFYLLGSVNPLLISEISESLAGRVAIIELTPFLFDEVKKYKSIDECWLRGGYPDALFFENEDLWQMWMENYVRTFIERDMARHGINLNPFQIRRFLLMLANIHGCILNSSELGKALGISYHTVNKYLDILENYFLIRRLQPYFVNIKKRLLKASKFYFRDSGLCHFLLNIKSKDDLIVSPKCGNSWEGFVIDQIISYAKLKDSNVQCYYFRTHAGLEVDLILDYGDVKKGIEIKLSTSVSKKDFANLNALIKEKIIDEGLVIYKGEHSFPVTDKINAMSLEQYLINN